MSPIGIILTILVIVFIYYVLKYIFTDPYTLQSLSNSQTQSTINKGSLANGGDSSNFSYSIWFYINDWNYRFGENKVVCGVQGLVAWNKGMEQ